MYLTPEILRQSGMVYDSMTYRDFKVDFYEDTSGRQIIAIWKNSIIEFGSDTTSYREDMMMIIDDHLDTITRFEEYPGLFGSKLAYFQNSDYRDIQLSYKGRLLKIYLLRAEFNEEDIKNDALKALNQYISEIALN